MFRRSSSVGTSWIHPGSILDLLGGISDHLQPILDHLGVHMAKVTALPFENARFSLILVPSWLHLGSSWEYVGSPWSPQRVHMAKVTTLPFEKRVAWAHLGSIMGLPGSISDHLGVILGNLSPILDHLSSRFCTALQQHHD